MFLDAREIPADTVIEADLCVIGAGPAGIAIALQFANKNVNVALLESGGLELDHQNQSLYQGENIGLPYTDLHSIRSRYFGGSSNCWGGWCRPFDAIDFEKRDWVPYSGWPFSRNDLDPYYERGACCVVWRQLTTIRNIGQTGSKRWSLMLLTCQPIA